MRASRFSKILRPQTVIREPACPFRAQTDLLTMHYSLKVFELKGQVGKFTQMTVCGRNEESRDARCVAFASLGSSNGFVKAPSQK